MIFIDAGVFIAASRLSDSLHARSMALLRQAASGGEALYTSDHVLDETVTFLSSKGGKETAYETGRRILRHERLQVEYNSPQRTEAAMELVGKIEGLSFCDALSIAVMQELGIKTIYSFDSDFDKIRGIRRIE